MNGSVDIVLRLKGPEGVIRIVINPESTIANVLEKISENYPNLPNDYKVWLDQKNSIELCYSRSKQHFKNGDCIFISYDPVRSLTAVDKIDEIIESQPGVIMRSRTKECNHNDNSMCSNCTPIDVFDEDYIKSINPPLKHLPFHVYLRRRISQTKRKSEFLLDEIRCSIVPGCKSHVPWPNGICTKCQPPSLCLTRQEFRTVDNIMFDNHHDVDIFISYWRKSMCQRIGFLYGYFEPLDNIPLGIRARIHAIYEPRQANSFDSVKIDDHDRYAKEFDTVSNALGYKKIGWILTDLLLDPTDKNKLLCTRNADSYVLSAQECLQAAYFQNENLNPCKYSQSGFFGSKFVTVVVTCNQSGQIDFYGWQVSNQCMALVKDNCLVPTVDEPSLAYVRESSNQQFVPDVFYKTVDKSGLVETKIARPVPVEYFLVEIPTGFPIQSSEPKKSSFPHFNREAIGEIQRMTDFQSFIKDPLGNFDDIDLLSYIYVQLEQPYLQEFLLEMCDLRKNNQSLENAILDERFTLILDILSTKIDQLQPNQQTNQLNISENSDIISVDSNNSNGAAPAFVSWACSICTYINNKPVYDSDNFIVCEVCGIPRDSA